MLTNCHTCGQTLTLDDTAEGARPYILFEFYHCKDVSACRERLSATTVARSAATPRPTSA